VISLRIDYRKLKLSKLLFREKLYFCFGRLNPRFSNLSVDELVDLYTASRKMWPKLVFGALSGEIGNAPGVSRRLRRAQRDIWRELSVRVRWKMISNLFGKPFPRGRTWDFTHCAAELQNLDPHWTPRASRIVVDAAEDTVTDDQKQMLRL
jgi:hypothetical protein